MKTQPPEAPDTARRIKSGEGNSTLQWSVPEPVRIPPPTIAPATAALGITLVAFGSLTSPIICIAGAVLAALGAALWIKEMHDAAEE